MVLFACWWLICLITCFHPSYCVVLVKYYLLKWLNGSTTWHPAEFKADNFKDLKKKNTLLCHTNIKIQCMNLNNGDTPHAATHSGYIMQNSSVAPRMHCGTKHVTTAEIPTPTLEVSVCLSILRFEVILKQCSLKRSDENKMT